MLGGSYGNEQEIAGLVALPTLSLGQVRRVCGLLRPGQDPPEVTSRMLYVRIRPLHPQGAAWWVVNRWAVDLGQGSDCQVQQEVDGGHWDAYRAAIRCVTEARRPLSDLFTGYGDLFGGLAEQVGQLGRDWWRWEPPKLRVVQVGLEWDTLHQVWNPAMALPHAVAVVGLPADTEGGRRHG